MGTAPCAAAGSSAAPSCVLTQLQVFWGYDTTCFWVCAEELLCRWIPVKSIPPQNSPKIPPAHAAAKQPGLQHPAPTARPVSAATVPSEGPHGQGHQSRGVSVRFSCSTKQQPSLARPQHSSLRHRQRCARLLAATRAPAWAAAGTHQQLHPRHQPSSPQASIPGENPVTPLGAERDSARALQGVCVLLNPCTALKFGVVFPLKPSAQGRWEQRCRLGDPWSQQPSSQSHPQGHPMSHRRRWEASPPAHCDIAKQFGGWSQLWVFWQNHFGVRHHSGFTAARDTSTDGRATAALAADQLCQPKPAWCIHPSPWLQRSPRAAPWASNSRMIPPGHLQPSRLSDRLRTCPSSAPRLPQHPPAPCATSTRFAPGFPISLGMRQPRAHICCALPGLGRTGEEKAPQIN